MVREGVKRGRGEGDAGRVGDEGERGQGEGGSA